MFYIYLIDNLKGITNHAVKKQNLMFLFANLENVQYFINKNMKKLIKVQIGWLPLLNFDQSFYFCFDLETSSKEQWMAIRTKIRQTGAELGQIFPKILTLGFEFSNNPCCSTCFWLDEMD